MKPTSSAPDPTVQVDRNPTAEAGLKINFKNLKKSTLHYPTTLTAYKKLKDEK